MRSGTVVVLSIVAISVLVRLHTWVRWASSGFDIGDVLLVSVLVALALARGDPVVALGIVGPMNAGAVMGAIAVYVVASMAGDRCRAGLLRECGLWVERAGVSAGGAGQALVHSPRRLRRMRAATFTASGALLEEVLFRGLLQRWLAVVLGPTLAVPLQAVVFGLVHAVPMAVAGAPRALVAYSMLMPTVTGAALGVLARYGLVYAWMVHWALNYRAAVKEVRSEASRGAAIG